MIRQKETKKIFLNISACFDTGVTLQLHISRIGTGKQNKL